MPISRQKPIFPLQTSFVFRVLILNPIMYILTKQGIAWLKGTAHLKKRNPLDLDSYILIWNGNIQNCFSGCCRQRLKDTYCTFSAIYFSHMTLF